MFLKKYLIKNKSEIKEATPYEIILFRVCFGLYLAYYNLSLVPDLLSYFGPSSMFRPELCHFLQPSLLFVFWSPVGIWSFFILMMGLIFLFITGFCTRYFVWILWALQVSFYNANPIIIHEPQQLANLLLLFFFFLPLGNQCKENEIEGAQDLVRLLVFFLSIYYLMAGLKKLPDPLWQQGTGISYILSWEALGKDNILTRFIIGCVPIGRLLNYGTLVFEISFIFLIFTRFKPLLVLTAFLFQFMIFLTLDVGSFPWIMIAWQVLLLDIETRKKYGIFFQKLRQRFKGLCPISRIDTLVLIDGDCDLCSNIPAFTSRCDPDNRIKFIALQSPAGQQLLFQHRLPTADFNSFVLIENGEVFTKSTAALKYFKRLNFPWSLLYIFIILPNPIRDFFYDFVAKNRYRWFRIRN